MKKTDISKIRNGMASGQGIESFTTEDNEGHELSYNLSGAVGVLERLVDEIDKGRTWPDDFPTNIVDEDGDGPSEEQVDHAQRAVQYFEDTLGSLLASFTEDDASIEDDNGNKIVGLPNAATTASKNANLPDVAT